MFQLLNSHFPALHNGFKAKRGCSYYKQQKIWKRSQGATWDRARLQEIEASFWKTLLLGVCERRFEKTCEYFWRILFLQPRPPQRKALDDLLESPLCSSICVLVCLISHFHIQSISFYWKKKSEGNFTSIDSLSPLQRKPWLLWQ